MFRAAVRFRLVVLLAVAAASLAVVGVAGAQNGDSDGDGVVNSQDSCPGLSSQQTSPLLGKPGCPAFRWDGSVGQSNLADTVDDGYVALHSRCQPGICTTTFTLTAGKKARKALGLKKALIGRKTLRQKLNRGGGIDSAVAEFDLPRKVVRKMDDLDKVELKAKFVVSAADSTSMQAVRFTESGTVKLDRRRPRSRSAPSGQGLVLVRGACKTASYNVCKEVNAD
jgi:hypothetical protein